MEQPTREPARPAPAGAAAAQPSALALFLVLGSMSVVGPAAMDIYLPGLPALADNLHAEASVAQLTIATFLVGLALGQFLSGPISDVHGRRRPLLIGMAAFSVVSLLCAFAPNVYALAGLRFVQGVVAAAGIAIGRAVVRDLYSGVAAAQYLSRLMLIIGLGPMLAPLAGGQLLRFTSWRGVFVALAGFGVMLVLAGFRWLPETLPRERRRASGIGQTARTFAALLSDGKFIGFVLVSGFGGGAMFAYIAGSAFVFEDVYGASPQFYGVLFGLNACFLIVGAQINAYILKWATPGLLLGIGLGTMVVAGVILVAAVTSHTGGLTGVVAPLTLLSFSWGFIASNALALALMDYPHVAGTAAGLIGVSQSVVGAAAAPLVGIGGRETALPMAVVVLVCGTVAALALIRLVPTSVRADAAAARSQA
jgi:DHA1 family bicyclomycin/chloramphenicol resistance-like MFS transporter